MATHSSTLAWKNPWTEELSRLPSMGPHRVRHDWSNLAAAASIYLKHTCLCFLVWNQDTVWGEGEGISRRTDRRWHGANNKNWSRVKFDRVKTSPVIWALLSLLVAVVVAEVGGGKGCGSIGVTSRGKTHTRLALMFSVAVSLKLTCILISQTLQWIVLSKTHAFFQHLTSGYIPFYKWPCFSNTEM